MASSFQFGDYALDNSNHISINVVREKSPAERAIGLLQPARGRGVSVVSVTPKAKIIEIMGTISVQNSINTFTDTVRDFIAVFVNQVANLRIGTNDGTFVYENCVCINAESMLRNEEHYNISYIPFVVQLLAPKGVVLDVSLTANAFSNISNSPYTNEINILGTAVPEPLIYLTMDSVGANSITNLTFLNRDTRESLSISTAFNSNDVVLIDTKNKTVQYNTKFKKFTGLLPRFKLGENRFRIDVQAATTLHQSQQTSDSERNIFGTQYLAQKFNPDAAISLSQVDLLLRRIEQPVLQLQLFDDFNDNARNARWTYTDDGAQAVEETGSAMRLHAVSPAGGNITNKANSSGGTGISGVSGSNFKGARWTQSYPDGGGENMSHYGQIRDAGGTNFIRVEHDSNQQVMRLILGGTYGSGTVYTATSTTGAIIDIQPSGADLQVRFNGALVYTISGKALVADSYVEFLASRSSGSGGFSKRLIVDDVSFYTETNANLNSDITVTIETDNAGVPSGTPVTNGTATIKVADVSPISFTIIPITFSSPPSLSDATNYHIVLKQSGGDVNNYYSFKKISTDEYNQGSVITTPPGQPTNWAVQSGEDLWFKVYTSFPTGFDLDAEINYFITHHSAV